MKLFNCRTALWGLVMSALLFLFAGCGGGGGDTESVAAAKMLTGVAATGAPVIGVVVLKDSSPTPVQLTTTTASDGSFAFNTTGLTPPFLLKTTVGGRNLYSLATDSGIFNLTPLTTLALANAAGGADLDALFTNHVQSAVNAAAARMTNAVGEVQTALAPLMSDFGVSTNILTGQFSANHTGIDAVLDAISVSISGGTVTITNKQNGAVIFSALASNLAAGRVNSAGLPGASGAPAAVQGTSLYIAKCAGCHGAITSTSLLGRTSVSATQNAIAGNLGGMGILAGLSATEIQAISDALMGQSSPPVSPAIPAAPSDGAALYATQCSGCHGALANSRKVGTTLVQLQNAISGDVGGMALLSGLSNADLQAVVSALNPAGSSPIPTPAPTPTTPTPVADGVVLYASYCASCHGALATTTKQGTTLARLQNAIAGNIGRMGTLSTLSVAQIQALVTALTPSTPTPTPTPSPTLDGATLYASSCAACHGALASSSKGNTTATRIQNAINGNVGGMGGLSSLSAAQVSAITSALAGVVNTPSAPAACGSCHAIPPASGHHSKHEGEKISCASCHGSGYSATSFNSATHNNGFKDIAAGASWNSSSRSCSNSCHGKETW
jgi:cytochrome c